MIGGSSRTFRTFFFSVLLTFCYCQLPQIEYNVTQLITAQGYNCVDYTVQTEDGYLLSMQNIPSNGPPVLLQHGFLDSSATWVLNSRTESLAFILSDAGYDVWLGNSRGNVYCQENVNFSNETQSFWDFSWDEMAAYDLPAKIDFVLENSSYPTLSYVGHSEGTLIGFTEFSSNNDTASKVNLFVALAPVVYLTHAGVLEQLSSDIPPLLIKQIFGTMSFLEPWSRIADAIFNTCNDDHLVCEEGVCALAGCERGNLNSTMLPVYFSHLPAGSSVQNLLHYQQSVRNPVYQHYDYGSSRENQKHYNQTTPPTYSLSTLFTPTALFYGAHDKLADPTDVQQIVADMPIPPYYIEEIARYGHADFIWGENAHKKVYRTIISLLDDINGK